MHVDVCDWKPLHATENGTKGERMGVVSRHLMVCGCDCSIAR